MATISPLTAHLLLQTFKDDREDPVYVKMKAAFDVFDKDKNGYLSVAEFKAILTHHTDQQLSDADAKEIMDR